MAKTVGLNALWKLTVFNHRWS